MSTEKRESTFIWYATHPRHGELILMSSARETYRYSYIYAPRMIFERLGKRMNPLLSLELSLGPVGFIERKYYEEAGFTVKTPYWLRMLAIADEHREDLGLNEEHVGDHDKELSAFILGEWEKVYKVDC